MANKILGLFKKPLPYESDGYKIKTHQFVSVSKEDDSIEYVEYSIEDVPEEKVDVKDVTLQHLVDNGIQPQAIRIQPDSRLGGDSELDKLASMAREHASDLFEK